MIGDVSDVSPRLSLIRPDGPLLRVRAVSAASGSSGLTWQLSEARWSKPASAPSRMVISIAHQAVLGLLETALGGGPLRSFRPSGRSHVSMLFPGSVGDGWDGRSYLQ